MWKFQKFSVTNILREINFGWFQKVKNCHFNDFEGFEFSFFFGISLLKMSEISKKSKFRASQMVKMAIIGALKWPKLISRKIWVADISWNFHIVFSQLGCPGLQLIIRSLYQTEWSTYRSFSIGNSKPSSNIFIQINAANSSILKPYNQSRIIRSATENSGFWFLSCSHFIRNIWIDDILDGVNDSIACQLIQTTRSK